MTAPQYTSLYAAFSAVPAPRPARGRRYPWPRLLLLIAATLLARATHVRGSARWLFWHAAAIRPLVPVPLPRLSSPATYYRAVRAVDLPALQHQRDAFTAARMSSAARPPATRRAVALDGKTVRGALAHGRACHLVSLVAHAPAFVETQRQVADKSSEQALAPSLLAERDLRDTAVTSAARHTHFPLAAQIRAQGGHYLIVVKENQPGIATASADLFRDPPWGAQPRPAEYEQVQTKEKGPGHLETRTLERSNMLNTDSAREWGWPGVGQVGKRMCVRLPRRTGLRQEGGWYALTSLSVAEASAAEVERLWRGHWTVENRVQHVRDVTLREDAGPVGTGNAPGALARVRNALLNLLRARGQQALPDALAEYAAALPKLFSRLPQGRL